MLPYVLLGQVMVRFLAAAGQPVGPLTYVTAGAGGWLLWFYGLAAFGQLPVDITLYGFLSVVVLGVVVWGHRPQSGREEHVWTSTLLGGLLLLPLWGILVKLEVFQALDVGFVLKSLTQVLALNRLPPGADLSAYGAQQVAFMPAAWVWLVPGQVLAGQVLQAMGPVLNGLLLLGIAGMMAAGAGVQTRWSNLPLVTAGSLLGVSLLNPFFFTGLVASAMPDILLAGAMLVLALPLMLPRPLPHGLAVLPLAFTAALVAGIHPATWPLLYGLGALWLVREVTVEQKTHWWLRISGWSVLVGVPLVSVLMWQTYAAGEFFELTYPVPQTLSFGGQRMMALGVSLGVWGVVIWRLMQSGRWGGPRLFYLSQGPWLVAATLLLVGTIYGENPWRMLVWLQFVVLLPYWRWGQARYQRSALKALAFRAPWALGGSLCLIFMGLLYSTASWWEQPVPPAVRHGQQVGLALAPQALAGKTIAVLEQHPGPRANLDRALGYQVAVIAADPLFRAADRSRAAFYHALRSQGADYLWIHSPRDAVRDMFRRPLRAERSYLFELSEKRFRLVETFPHFNYTGSGW